MKMKKFHTVLGIVALTTVGGAALAHGGGRGGFKKADTNDDGKVTLAEALAAGKERFDRKDANKDGTLSGDEIQGRMRWMVEKADANKDGKVTAAEHETIVRKHFTDRDANKDGALTRDEMGRSGKQGRYKGEGRNKDKA
jgi:hypothetical protein